MIPFFVTLNKNILDGLTLEGVRWAFTTSYEASWIPLTWISYMLDIQLFGLNPGCFHMVNVLLHTASTLLLFLFLSLTTGERWKSGMVAFLFALHPLHVESVAWVSERKDVLSAFFWMLTLCAYAHYTRSPGFMSYTACLAGFTLGLLAKPMMVTFPLVLLVLDLWPLRRFDRDGEGADVSRLIRLLVEKLPFAALAVAVSIVTYVTSSAGGVVSGNYTVLARAGKVVVNYVTYLWKMVWPSGLTVFYQTSLVPPSFMKIMGSVIFLVSVTIAVCLVKGSRRYLLAGWLWYLITLLPVIGLVQVGSHSIADRYTYIPLVGIFVMTVWGVPDVLGDWKQKKPALWVGSCVLMVILIAMTSYQLGHWKNSITLFSHAVAVTERNPVARNNLGYALLEAGRIEEAIMHFRHAIEERPADTFALMNLGDAYRREGDFGKALDAYKRVLFYDPRNENAHYSMGRVFLDIGQVDLAHEKVRFLSDIGSQLAPELMREIVRYGGMPAGKGKP